MINRKSKGTRSPYLLIVILILIAGIGLWQFYKYKIVNKNVTKAVEEKSKGLYSLHYDNIFIDEVTGKLQVKNISIIPDTSVYNQMMREKTNPPVLLKITIPLLNISGVKTPKALLTKQIDGSIVEIANPDIEIQVNDFFKDSTVYSPGKEIYKELLGKLQQIKIYNAQIRHANVTVMSMKSNAVIFKGDNVSFLLNDLLIDSAANKDSTRILFSKNVEIGCDKILLPSKNKKYRFDFEKLRYTSQNNSFYVGEIRIMPEFNEEEFARISVFQKDRYDFLMKGITFFNIHRENMWHKNLVVDSLVIKNSSFKIYHDRSYPRDTVFKIRKYPQQQLISLPIPVFIKKIIFGDSFIEYKEKREKSDSAGKVQFYKVHAVINNVTNMQDSISRNNKCILFFNAKFLDKAPLNVVLTMLLKNPKQKFLVEGNFGAMDGNSLNVLTQPLGLARIDKGKINHLHFSFTGTDSLTTGKLTILYNDIKISLLKKNNEKNKYNKKTLPSFATNILLKKSNPENDKESRIAVVQYKRAPQSSFFSLLWKSIFTGVKENAGLK
jgi:hypothetical protein